MGNFSRITFSGNDCREVSGEEAEKVRLVIFMRMAVKAKVWDSMIARENAGVGGLGLSICTGEKSRRMAN